MNREPNRVHDTANDRGAGTVLSIAWVMAAFTALLVMTAGVGAYRAAGAAQDIADSAALAAAATQHDARTGCAAAHRIAAAAAQRAEVTSCVRRADTRTRVDVRVRLAPHLPQQVSVTRRAHAHVPAATGDWD